MNQKRKASLALALLLSLGALQGKQSRVDVVQSLRRQFVEPSPQTRHVEYVPESKSINWYRFAEFSTLPNLMRGKNLNDGNPGTGARWAESSVTPIEMSFKFPYPIHVEAFRIIQGSDGATEFRLFADRDGDGICETVAVHWKHPEVISGKPITVKVDMKTYGLRFQTIQGVPGYCFPFPSLKEVSIFSDDDIRIPELPKTGKHPVITPGKEVRLPNLHRRNVDIRICTDLWSYGIQLGDYSDPNNPRPAKPRTPEQIKKGVKGVVDFLRSVDANSVRLFVESVAGSDCIPWKNTLTPGYGVDVLKHITSGLHAHGIKLYYFSHAWMSPFQKRGQRANIYFKRWDYPYEQNDKLNVTKPDVYKVKYPCTISDPIFRDQWTAYLLGALENGADGVYLMPDEWYYTGHDLPYCTCKACQREFKKMYGYDSLPKKIEDTEKFRKWKLFEYQKLADLFDYTATKIRKHYPKAKIVRSDCAVNRAARSRLDYCAAADIYWKRQDLADAAQMYCEGDQEEIAFVKDHEAIIPRNKLSGSVQWLNISWQNPAYAIELYGSALPSIMLGARAIDHYRMSYIQRKAWTDNMKECSKMIRLLEAWDIHQTAEPATVCLLLSRASEDWWSAKQRAHWTRQNKSCAFYMYDLRGPNGDSKSKLPSLRINPEEQPYRQEDMRGNSSKTVICKLFLNHGVPFKIRYTDRVDTLKDLSSFKLLVLPFSYAMSQEAYAQIRKAALAGTKVLIFDQLAPVDDLGNAYEKPLLQKLLKLKNVTFVNEPLSGNGSNFPRLQQVFKLVEDRVRDAGYAFQVNDDLEISYLTVKYLNDSGWILFLGNWDRKQEAHVDLALPGAKGATYSGLVYSPMREELNQVLVNGKAKLTADDLKAFTVNLKPGEVKLIRIVK